MSEKIANLAVIIGALIAAIAIGLVGVLVYASPSETDQVVGRIMIAAAALILVMTYFHQNPSVALLLKAIVTLTFIGMAWLLWRMFGR